MNNEKLNVKASVNDELLEDISGGIIPDSMGTGRCSVCGNIVPNLNLVNHPLHKVCKDCMKKTCETCEKTKGSSLGHDYGDEEIINPDYIAAAATFVKTCSTCKEQESREGALTSLHDGSVVLMSADEFSARFTEKLMEVQTLLGDDQYLSTISESDDVLCMYLCQRVNGKITQPGYFVMRDLNDENLSYTQHAEGGAFMGVVGTVSGVDQTALAIIAMTATMDSSLALTDVTQQAADWLNGSSNSLKLNGLTYSYAPIDKNNTLVGFTVHE